MTTSEVHSRQSDSIASFVLPYSVKGRHSTLSSIHPAAARPATSAVLQCTNLAAPARLHALATERLISRLAGSPACHM
jgi:hypothetical protein